MNAFIERWWRGRDPIVGIDIRDDGIVFADVDVRGTTRWLAVDTGGSPQGHRSLLGDTALFKARLRDFIGDARFRIERCAVGIPETSTYIGRVSLPTTLMRRSKRARYEAALDQLYLRPKDVRGRIYPCHGDSTEATTVLVVAAKRVDVDPLEDAVRSAGLELACLTPRIFAFHHIADLAGAVRDNSLIALVDSSHRSQGVHLFKGAHYHAMNRDYGGASEELRNGVEGRNHGEGKGEVVLIMNEPAGTELCLAQRDLFSRAVSITELPLPGVPRMDPRHVVATGLSLWEGYEG
jgi:hypothetical protein